MRIERIVATSAAHASPNVAASARSKGWDFWTVEIDNLSRELKDEKARVQKEEEGLDLRAARLAAERQELEKLRTELSTMHDEISAKVIEIQADESKNLRMLAQTYSSLTPHAAVAIIHELDDSTAVKILSLMKPDVIGPIFEDMAQGDPSGSNAHRAAVLSEKIRLLKAQRTAQTP
jgi:flagellar motility protein MotE (MotC chaperone)